jgi:predicted amidophosphoribosyltransferase
MRAHIQSVAIAQQQAAAAAARGIDTGPAFCPSCRREFPSKTAFCPFDSNRLVAISGHEELLAGPAGGICPACKRGFNPGVRVCPHDGEELVPHVAADARGGTSPPPVRGKICPTCGGRFDGTAAFCGKDGTQLVLLN